MIKLVIFDLHGTLAKPNFVTEEYDASRYLRARYRGKFLSNLADNEACSVIISLMLLYALHVLQYGIEAFIIHRSVIPVTTLPLLLE